MKHLILTLDYELYGDGSGNVFEHIIKPTERILTIAEAYNARLTIFFEVIEYWRLKEQWYNGNHMGYAENPITAIEEQLRDAYARGHDIQLHLHPHWVNAYWHDNHWIVDNSCWRLSVLPQVEIAELLKKGKQTIENILGADEFHCNVFRAGGYNIQPSENVVKAMQSSGFIADTSIYPGGNECGSLSRYNYSIISYEKGIWYCGDNLEMEVEKSDIIELPIVAFPMIRLKKYMSLSRILAVLRNRHSAARTFAAKTSNSGSSGKINKLFYFFCTESQTWDYCLFSPSMHCDFLRKIKKQTSRHFFVLVGHPKSLVTTTGFEYLLQHAVGYDFPTMTDMLHTLDTDLYKE